mmetsp:Transcript_18488/g.23037  ORF Transcript_18488/g.23037 Transcript_18488/m.23037 type:complete len:313 (-) Transcript_18488:208-1146(-)
MIRHVHLHTVTRQRLLHPRLDLGGHIHRAGWRRERLLRERCRSLPGGRLWLGWLVYAPLPKAEARELRTHVPRRVQLLVLLERAVYGLLGKRAEHESLDAFECVADGTADNGIGYSGRSSEDRPTHTADHPRHGFHPLRLLLCIDGLGDCADNLERWARRLGLISGRPLGARHDGRILPKVGCSVSVEDLIALVVLINGVPPATCASAAEDLAILLERRLAASLARATIPRPVDARLGASRVVGDLEEPHSCLLLADEAAGNVLHEDGEVFAKPLAFLAEEGRFGNAPRVDAGEGDTRLLVVPLVQHIGGHH